MQAALRASEALRLSSVSSPAVRAATAQRYNPSALAAAALRDTAAAVAAAAATATGSPPAGFNMSSALASIEEVKWPLLDAITACAAEVVGRPSQTTPAVAITERTGDQQGSGDGAGDVLGGGRLVLQRELLVELMGQAVAALGEYPEGQVLPLLRCARRCWVEVLAGGPELQVSRARQVVVGAGACSLLVWLGLRGDRRGAAGCQGARGHLAGGCEDVGYRRGHAAGLAASRVWSRCGPLSTGLHQVYWHTVPMATTSAVSNSHVHVPNSHRRLQRAPWA